MKTPIAFLFAAATSFGAAQAHEFWIEPHAYVLNPGDPVVADIKVGEEFKGSAYAFIPKNIREFGVIIDGTAIQANSRMGDRPALNMAVPGEGLGVILHMTANSILKYTEAKKFEAFVAHKDFPWALEAHKERGLPETGFSEVYSRYAKSLVAIGDGAGQDRAFGMVTEIVALANPYTDDLSNGLPVQVLFQGEPRADVQLEIYEAEGDAAVTVSTLRTDAEGRAVVPVQPGREYMLDSVVMLPVEAENDLGVVWETLWANLTFEVPEG